VALAAPVIRQVAGGVLHHPHPQLPKLLGVPAGDAALSLVFSGRDLGPVRGAKRQCIDVHDGSFVYSRRSRGGSLIPTENQWQGKPLFSLPILLSSLLRP